MTWQLVALILGLGAEFVSLSFVGWLQRREKNRATIANEALTVLGRIEGDVDALKGRLG